MGALIPKLWESVEKIVISAVILCLLFILVGEKKTSVGFESFGELVAAELG